MKNLFILFIVFCLCTSAMAGDSTTTPRPNINSLSSLPIGTIVLWDSPSIPAGWAICNYGGRFVRSVGGGHSLGETGGRCHAQHFRDFTSTVGGGRYPAPTGVFSDAGAVGSNNIDIDNGYYPHVVRMDFSSQVNTADEFRPKYTTLYYIKKVY